MKYSKKHFFSRAYKIPQIRFEDQKLSSFSGLIIFHPLFQKLDLKERLRQCFRHLHFSEIISHHVIMMLLIIHLLLGFRRLRDMDYYKDDPLVKRLLGMKRLPDVSTVCRALKSTDLKAILKIRDLNRQMVIERLKKTNLSRLTADFDGSVLSTSRKAEGTAVGYNKKKKGARSYYPLFCTIAQTGQVFDFYHRPGNVHDSNGAKEFIHQCLSLLKQELPGIILEVRMDSAFFSEEIVTLLDQESIEFRLRQ